MSSSVSSSFVELLWPSKLPLEEAGRKASYIVEMDRFLGDGFTSILLARFQTFDANVSRLSTIWKSGNCIQDPGIAICTYDVVPRIHGHREASSAVRYSCRLLAVLFFQQLSLTPNKDGDQCGDDFEPGRLRTTTSNEGGDAFRAWRLRFGFAVEVDYAVWRQHAFSFVSLVPPSEGASIVRDTYAAFLRINDDKLIIAAR
ncbi:hypothetical protein SCHPADRAFT_945682 [Schizopora paradoxa]|uniref:Uncharacterized protein n=1 Tax=Schizopora paradoxa TaxID=27342 RepID=A0A0H2R6I8_9AGAM|nr:hypothetical protein SCHPADRAFT_945682 [Schizopora paradoxa]